MALEPTAADREAAEKWWLSRLDLRDEDRESFLAGILRERAFWEPLLDEATGTLADISLSDDLSLEVCRKKARHHYAQIKLALAARGLV